ncbi:TPA: hypothetical protein ACH3X1_003911 [Trebouxia sp. C0004]
MFVRILSMACFASEAELEIFLDRLDPDHSQFASALWQNGVRTLHQLANAREPILPSCGLPELYIDDIKARADRTGETAPESSRVLTAVLESMDERLHTIELGVKLSPYQTKVRLRSASRASNESRPDNNEFKLALIRAYQPQQELKTTLFCMVTGVELPKKNIVGDAVAGQHNTKRTWYCGQGRQ